MCYIFSIPPRRGVQHLTRDDPTAFAPPPAFGPFRVLHQIGVGALGPVFRTYEPTRDRLVAVKVFRLDITPEQAQSLADELARAAEAGLFHASIVEPIAAGVEGTVAYRAEEYVAAESLDVAMRHYAPASLDKALPFITQLAGAIDFARAAGVGHGALHPRDIFVTPDEARATGFGVVDALERVNLRAPVRRPYSAPERIAASAWSTPADVFSLAAIAFELLTGRRPSGAGDQIGPLTGAIVPAHLDEIRAVLVRAMHEDPDRRYSTALAFAAALEAAASGDSAAESTAEAPAVAPSTPAGPTSPESGRPAETERPPLTPIATGVEDDIAAERDEDEAHWQLTREEAAAAAEHAEAPAEPLFSDEAVKAAGDKLAFDAADMALSELPPPPQFADEFRLPAEDRVRPSRTPTPRSIPVPARPTPRPSIAPTPARERQQPEREPSSAPAGILQLETSRGAYHGSFDAAAPEVSRSPVLPVAVGVMLGLLIGFAAGYFVGHREVPPQQIASGATADTQAGTPQPQATASQPQAPGAGKEFTEQPVAPRTAQPPATPPDTPRETPPSARREPPKAAAPLAGRLVVRSTPSGANVTVNGRAHGRTPLALDKVPFGNYSVRLTLPGYETAREDVKLSASDTAQTVAVDLKRQVRSMAPRQSTKAPAISPKPAAPPSGRAGQPVAYTGSIYVDSLPRGARVLLDGRPVGTTPLRLPDVPVGSHVIRLELVEHHSWSNSTTVQAGQEARVTGSLEPIR